MLLFNFELLRNHRRQRGLTQEQWGKIIGVSGATVGNWERAVSYPDAQELSRIATICGVSDINDYFIERVEKNNDYQCKN